MKRMRMGLVTALAILTLVGFPMAEPAAPPAEESTPPADLPLGWYARIETSKGHILARLLPEQAPQSVAHFAALAEGRLEWTDPLTGETRSGPYYDGTIVHKAVAGQRIEAGDRTGTGRGAPRLYVPMEGEGPVNFRVGGRLGMTRSSGKRISAAQFFVTYTAQPWLDGRHPCFGSVIEGRDVVFEISSVKTYSNGRPIDPVGVEAIRIFKVGDPPPLPEPVPFHPQLEKLELREELRPGS